MGRWIILLGILGAVGACGGDSDGTSAPTEPDPPAEVPAAVGAWLETYAHPFDGSRLTLPHDDLSFLPELIGDARIVSLGENTHGTRDFFEMKARILRYLVEEMGFNAFAIEATWPESYRLDEYVRTGVGDGAVYLTGLYFWTWRTESVLEMIEWMRSHNAAGGDVGFYGFDMQFPGMALHNVREFIALADPDRDEEVGALLACLVRYANGPDGRAPNPGYREETEQYRADCGASLESVRDLLLEHQSAYEAETSPEAFAHARQSLRVAEQFHLMITGDQSRDQSMAENTVWLANQLGPESKLVLWAHNFHVSMQPGAQGSYMRQAFGDDMVVVGFSHEAGRFTAVRQTGSTYQGLDEHVLDPVRDFSYEFFLSAAPMPRFVLDLRNVNLSEEGSDWLSTSRSFRSIGCCYDPSLPARYWFGTPLTSWYDVLIHYERTGATTILQAQWPTEF